MKSKCFRERKLHKKLIFTSKIPNSQIKKVDKIFKGKIFQLIVSGQVPCTHSQKLTAVNATPTLVQLTDPEKPRNISHGAEGILNKTAKDTLQ